MHCCGTRTGVRVPVDQVRLHGVVPPVERVLAAPVPVELDQLQAAAVDRHARAGLYIDLHPPGWAN